MRRIDSEPRIQIAKNIHQGVLEGFESNVAELRTLERNRIITQIATNVDGNVYAFKHRLPPILTSVLVTRQSRSAEPDMRQILWDEFIVQPEVGFESLVSYLVQEDGLEQMLATQKAGETMDRIINSFGDDSVREQADGAVGIQKATVLFSMTAFREPLITGIEASTRYINWGKKVDGNYLYREAPATMSPEDRQRYTEAMDNLFDTYAALYQPVLDYIRAKTPKEPGQTDRAYNTATRGRAFDNLRRLLPLGCLTNFGIHANYRSFSEMVMNLSASNLPEARETAAQIATELMQVNPQFMKVSQDRHGEAWVHYKSEADQLIDNFGVTSTPNLGTYMAPEGVHVRVLNRDYQYDLVRAAIAHNNAGLTEGSFDAAYLKIMGRNELENVLKYIGDARTNRRHKVPDFFNSVVVNASFNRLSFAAFKDFNRHRNILQKSEPNYSGELGFQIPDDIAEMGPGIVNVYLKAQMKAIEAYHALREDYPVEARMLLTHGTNTSYEVTMSLGEAFWMSELRSIASGDPEYRRIAMELYRQTRAQIPELSVMKHFVNFGNVSLNRIDEAVKADLRGALKDI